jgi:hypothetical protein
MSHKGKFFYLINPLLRKKGKKKPPEFVQTRSGEQIAYVLFNFLTELIRISQLIQPSGQNNPLRCRTKR